MRHSHTILSASAYPDWITPELIARTLHVWQKRSPTLLTEADAVDMLITVGRLADVLMSSPIATETTVKRESMRY
jgi:hypothetical protein